MANAEYEENYQRAYEQLIFSTRSDNAEAVNRAALFKRLMLLHPYAHDVLQIEQTRPAWRLDEALAVFMKRYGIALWPRKRAHRGHLQEPRLGVVGRSFAFFMDGRWRGPSARHFRRREAHGPTEGESAIRSRIGKRLREYMVALLREDVAADVDGDFVALMRGITGRDPVNVELDEASDDGLDFDDDGYEGEAVDT